MREVSVSRFVRATTEELQRELTPARIVQYEGSFDATSVEPDGDGTIVTAEKRGLSFQLRFEPQDDGFYYTQVGEMGPFEEMETWLTMKRKDDGSVVTVRSAVDLGIPLPGTGRFAAWKRKGELKRLLDRLADDH